jgi:hypothetical protein
VAGGGRKNNRYRTQHIEDSRGEGRFVLRGGHDHWVMALFAGGSFNDGDSPQVTFTVDARKLMLLQDDKLASGSPVHHARQGPGE